MSKQKAKGTRMETGFVNYMKARLPENLSSNIHRAALTGAADQGDIHGLVKLFPEDNRTLHGIAEIKNHKTVTAGLIQQWHEETLTECTNADADFGILVFHKNGCDQTGKTNSYGHNIVQMPLKYLLMLIGRTGNDDNLDNKIHDIWISMNVDDFINIITN